MNVLDRDIAAIYSRAVRRPLPASPSLLAQAEAVVRRFAPALLRLMERARAEAYTARSFGVPATTRDRVLRTADELERAAADLERAAIRAGADLRPVLVAVGSIRWQAERLRLDREVGLLLVSAVERAEAEAVRWTEQRG